MTTRPPWRSTPMTSNRTGAFTAVNARRSLSAKTETVTKPNHGSSSSTTTKTVFPDKLKEYVARSFEGVDEGPLKQAIEKELKIMITDAFQRDVAWTTDWDKMELPQVLMKKRGTGLMDLDTPFMKQEEDVLEVNEEREYVSKKLKTNNENGFVPTTSSNHSPYSTTVNSYTLTPSPPPRDSGDSTYSRYSPSYDSKKRKSFGSSDEVSYSNVSNRADRRSPKSSVKDYASNYQEMTARTSGIDLMKDKRAKRFSTDPNSRSTSNTPPWKRDKESQYSTLKADVSDGPIVGRCMELEKKYFRLTSAPDPDKVRPLHVLEKTLEFLKKKWRKENNYAYICDQLKSVRQDLTVQHIKNEFTINVYEIHARIALEKGDLGEYNQCQSQLRLLYREIPGAGHPNEFTAYRILYLLHTCNETDMGNILAELTQAEKEDKNIQHALSVRKAMAVRNYYRFFRLYVDCPNMGCYLMDSFVERERLAAMEIICKAYRSYVDLRFLTEELGFESDSECAQFLDSHGAGAYLVEKRDEDGTATGVKFNCPPARPLFTDAKDAAFRKVDIKGQI